MIGANMVGYVIGLDGAKEIFGEIFAFKRKFKQLVMIHIS